jgi:hypothetical protein
MSQPSRYRGRRLQYGRVVASYEIGWTQMVLGMLYDGSSPEAIAAVTHVPVDVILELEEKHLAWLAEQEAKSERTF